MPKNYGVVVFEKDILLKDGVFPTRSTFLTVPMNGALSSKYLREQQFEEFIQLSTFLKEEFRAKYAKLGEGEESDGTDGLTQMLIDGDGDLVVIKIFCHLKNFATNFYK